MPTVHQLSKSGHFQTCAVHYCEFASVVSLGFQLYMMPIFAQPVGCGHFGTCTDDAPSTLKPIWYNLHSAQSS